MKIRYFGCLALLACLLGVFLWFAKQPRPPKVVSSVSRNVTDSGDTLTNANPPINHRAANDLEVRDDHTELPSTGPRDSTTSNHSSTNDLESLSLRLKMGTDEEKKEVAARLSELGTAKATQILIAQLDADNAVPVRLALLAAVSGLTSEEALDTLIACCLGDAKKYDVREAARSSLTENASPTSIDKILKAVRSRQDDQWFVRDAAKVFRGYSNPELVPHLNAGLLASQSYVEAEMSAEALAKIGTPEAASALVSAALSLSDEKRTAAVSAIAHVTGTGGVQRLAQIDVPDNAEDVKRAITKAVAPSSNNP